jgi:hypothetical protein
MSKFLCCICCCMAVCVTAAHGADSWVPEEFRLFNIVPPMLSVKGKVVPIEVRPFVAHVRGRVEMPGDIDTATALKIVDGALALDYGNNKKCDGHPVTAQAIQGKRTWIGTASGLYVQVDGDTTFHDTYGLDGPLATKITGLAVDSKGALWVGTPLGLSRLDSSGVWSHFQGRQGLPVENITSLAIDKDDNLWIGTSHGAILFKPYSEGRQWYYRAGKRYLPGDNVKSVAVAPEGNPVYFLTDGGLGKIDLVTTTLLERAQTIEERVNKYHRRLGLVAACTFDNAENPTTHTIQDFDNDGLWTAYHVAAMSLCYGATGDPSAKASAREGMHALYMLQNASGTPGLVARSVVPAEIGKTKNEQWRPTPDGTMYWKSDTSSDEIDGHYLAFYAYFEHIAKEDPEEKKSIEKQVREVTDYIIGNNYQLIDWDGKRTRWGFWNPEALNENPMDYIESGLNALQILSFLKTAYYITGDENYEKHFRKLAVDHHYLNNILLTKRCFPDENNHSDDQLGFVAWYPILQTAKDPFVRKALLAGVRRHYAVVKPEKPSFYTFVYATINPLDADLEAGAENLMNIPTDRRVYAVRNSHRADVQIDPRPNRFDRPVLTRVLPVDERHFDKWNVDPYEPDEHADGREENDGAAYLLPYWMARYHGFIREAP